MSVSSIISCGPEECQRAQSKPRSNISRVQSYCQLKSCADDKNITESGYLQESCKPYNCNYFWNRDDTLKTKVEISLSEETNQRRTDAVIINESDSKFKIFDYPVCRITECPKKQGKTGSARAQRVPNNTLQVGICGPPNCCTNIGSSSTLLDFGVVCDLVTQRCKKLRADTTLGSSRNKVYYCVSPSLYADIDLAFQQDAHCANKQTVRRSQQKKEQCPRPNAGCYTVKQGKLEYQGKLDSPMDQPDITIVESIEDITEGNEIVSSFNSFHSNQKLVDGKQYNNDPNYQYQSNTNTNKYSPEIIDLIKEFSKKALTTTQDFPPTPMPSATDFAQNKVVSPFREFPFSPQDIQPNQENIVRQYLHRSDDPSEQDGISLSPSQVTRKNKSEVNALLKAVYLTTIDDFPASPTSSFSYEDNFHKTKTKESSQTKQSSQIACDEMPKCCDNATDPTKKPKCCSGQEPSQNGLDFSAVSQFSPSFIKKEESSYSEKLKNKPSSSSANEKACCYEGKIETVEKSDFTFSGEPPKTKISKASPISLLSYEDNFHKTKTKESSQTKQSSQIACDEKPKCCDNATDPTKKPKISNSNTCDPKTCDKLNLSGNRKWKNCCDKLCPISDPTASTYNFLLKVRMCCGKRGCQLASRICDIYEPLVQIDTNFEDVGEPQYHYLAADAFTVPEPETEEKSEPETEEKSEPESEPAPAKVEEASSPLTSKAHENSTTFVDTKSENDIEPVPETRRTSTVSWIMPTEVKPSTSQQKVISEATAAADKFRKTHSSARHGSIFEEIVQKTIDEPPILVKKKQSSEMFNPRSQVNTVTINDSRHKQKCCPSLREKFRRKKKKFEKENDDSVTQWPLKEQRKTHLGVEPVREKKPQMEAMPSKV